MPELHCGDGSRRPLAIAVVWPICFADMPEPTHRLGSALRVRDGTGRQAARAARRSTIRSRVARKSLAGAAAGVKARGRST